MFLFNTAKRLIPYLACMGFASTTYADPGDTFLITDFDFGMEVPAGQDNFVINKVIGTPGTLVDGTFQGTQVTNEVVSFDYFGSPVITYTAASGVDTDGIPFIPTNGDTTPIPDISTDDHPPINIDRTTLLADMSSFYAFWSDIEFNQGTSNVAVIDNQDNTYDLSWSKTIIGGFFHGRTGNWKMTVDCTSCPDVILDLPDTLTVTQATYITLIVSQLSGDVVVASAKGANPASTAYTWITSNSSIIDTDSDQGTFTFDPSSVPVGDYTISHSYSDTSSFPPRNGSGSVQIRVVADSVGNYLDSDGDGIPNAYESGLLTSAQLQSTFTDQATYVIETDSGTIKVGDIAFCASSGARITIDDIIAYGAGNCEPATDASDDLIEAIGVGGFYSFEVNGLTTGSTANIVIPLTANIPSNATYRKYTSGSGWSIFDVSGDNALASAASTNTGVCPAVGDAAYVSGLNEGDNCVQLTIVDGGPNDADNSANGNIQDPGGVAKIKSGTEATLASGCSISGKPSSLNNHSEWLLLFAALAWLGLSTRTRKQ